MLFQWETIVFGIIGYVIFLLLMTIFLKLSLGLFSKAQNTNFGRVFLTSLLITVVVVLVDILFGFIPLEPWVSTLLVAIIGILFILLVISGMHKTGIWRALVIGIIAIILYIIIMWVVGLILALFGIYI